MAAAKFAKYPKIKSLLTLAQQSKISYKGLMFSNQLLSFCESQGLEFIETNFDAYLGVVNRQVDRTDCTWQRIMMALDFEEEF